MRQTVVFLALAAFLIGGCRAGRWDGRGDGGRADGGRADGGRPFGRDRPDEMLVVAGEPRFYLLHRPAGVSPSRSAPLVVALHGLTMNARQMPALTGLNRAADREGWLVAYPEGSEFRTGHTWKLEAESDDEAFLVALLDHLAGEGADRRRVYLAGVSQGGAMAYRLLCRHAERFRAAGIVAGYMVEGLPGSGSGSGSGSCSPARGVPILHLHGSQDRVVPVAGDRGRRPLAGTADFWRGYGSEFQLELVEDGGHVWFRDATRRIVDFFKAH